MDRRYLKIVWLYHDLLNLYGDRGNVLTLKSRAEKRDIKVSVVGLSIGEPIPNDTDIIFMGGGQDQDQVVVAKDLQNRKAELVEFVNKKGAILAICGSYQLLGDYYQPLKGKRIEGIGLLPAYTEATNRRMIGDLVAKPKKGQGLIGFENHSGETFLKAGEPLGIVKIGFGNNGQDKSAGMRLGSIVGTYLHGPVLPKNPWLADEIIKNGLESHGDYASLPALKDKYVAFARQQAEKRARSRKKRGLGLRS